jgi:hypothetical protein
MEDTQGINSTAYMNHEFSDYSSQDVDDSNQNENHEPEK